MSQEISNMEDLQIYLEKIKGLHNPLNEIAHFHIKASPHLRLADMFVFGVLNRALSLIYGFCDLIEKQNYLSAAPLVRLQLDNALRFYAICLVDDQSDLVGQIMGGTPIRKIKDRNGQRMTDAYLVEQLSKEFDWVANLYSESSSYIHLSEQHILSMMLTGPKNDDGSFPLHMTISHPAVFVPQEAFLSAAIVFFNATDLVLRLVGSFAKSKSDQG